MKRVDHLKIIVALVGILGYGLAAAFEPGDCGLPYSIDKDNGVLYSNDCGYTWFPTGAIEGVPPVELTSVSIDQTGRVIVSTDTMGLYASKDGGMTWTHAGPNVSVTASIQYLGGDEAIPAGHPGRFRVTIRNSGTGASTNTTANFAWFRTPIIGESVSYDYTMRPSQGRCVRSVTPSPDCTLGTIPGGGTVEIDFDGSTEPGRLGWYTLRLWVASDQAAPTMLAESSKGTSITVLETGGGASGALWLLALSCAAVFSAIRRRSGYRG